MGFALSTGLQMGFCFPLRIADGLASMLFFLLPIIPSYCEQGPNHETYMFMSLVVDCDTCTYMYIHNLAEKQGYTYEIYSDMAAQSLMITQQIRV